MENDSHTVESRSNEMPVYDVAGAGKDGMMGKGICHETVNMLYMNNNTHKHVHAVC